MSDAVVDEAPETEEGEAQEESPPPKRKLLSGKRIVIGLGGIVILAVGAYMSGMLDSVVGDFLGGEESGEEVASDHEPIYYDMPEMLVNLSTSDSRQSYLKIAISFELEDEVAISELKKVMPRIVDNFQTYLRELRPEDLSGSAGVYRLKEELLTRVNTAVHPIVIYDVLFAEMLVQ
jgi:flagellar FliL protein